MTLHLKAFSAVVLGVAALASSTFAQTPFQQTHPRRADVNGRLGAQNARIRAGRADGQLTGRQAGRLHREDRTIRREERFDARLDHGHVTGAEKRSLNQQENAVSRQIYNERH